jgi:serine/threonine-protein kinase
MSVVPASSAADPRVGVRINDRYELRRVVADGGTGRVYEGADLQTDTRIAVKVLHDDVALDPVALERFRREYELSKSLPHAHIVDVLDFAHDARLNIHYLVMEFLDGEELRYVLKREKVLAPERLIRMMAQVAKGLDEAHARGFIHRDLKPDNLFLCGTREGDICKILDFGSVKDRNARRKLTQLGTTIGSPYYMSPEQAQGLETIDARSDVFSLAAVAYECVTGFVPFDGNNGPSILLAIMTQEPVMATARGIAAKYPIVPAVDDVLEEGLAKNAAIRTASVGALADAIGRAYGLQGGHGDWAYAPQSELAAHVAAAVATVPITLRMDDPFAAGGPGAQLPTSPTRAQEAAFGGPHEHGGFSQPPMGLPSRSPWLLLGLIGFLALLVGGGLVVLVLK